ncbi:SREBP regulating gene protein isoform X5 [Tursiops truncatus]|uniref:SREBP regulating gene protein isoform X5 n=1 Tax=Tursiops truncatus TaxID=9739 RepID=UPI003CCF6770
MVNLAAMVWRRLLRKRWVLALVFGLSLVYFLTSTFKQEERAVRDRNLLQVHDHDQPIPWKVQFNLGNSSRPSNQCRNSIQGKHLITDELGYVCERKDLLVNGCCNVNVPGTKQYCCDGCLSNGCCSAYEYCVSCCLQPNKQLLLERFLNRAAVAFQNLFMAVEDHFELCLAKCRTSSQMGAFTQRYEMSPRQCHPTRKGHCFLCWFTIQEVEIWISCDSPLVRHCWLLSVASRTCWAPAPGAPPMRFICVNPSTLFPRPPCDHRHPDLRLGQGCCH